MRKNMFLRFSFTCLLLCCMLLLNMFVFAANNNDTLEFPKGDMLLKDLPAIALPTEDTTTEDSPIEKLPTTDLPVVNIPIEDSTSEDNTIDDLLPTEDIPVVQLPEEDDNVEKNPIDDLLPAEDIPVVQLPEEDNTVEENPIDDLLPTEDIPVVQLPDEDSPVEENPIDDLLPGSTFDENVSKVLNIQSSEPELGGVSEESDLNSEDVHYYDGDNATIENKNTTHSIIIERGTVNLTIKDVTINAVNQPAILIEAGAILNLTIEGENNLTGGLGYAGINVVPYWDDEYHVEQSAILNIYGDGILNVTGGLGDDYNGSGAGIGGNGMFFSDLNKQRHDDAVDFGIINVTEEFTGTIIAKGGNVNNSATYDRRTAIGAGAGIGAGGLETRWGEAYGQIDIKAGTIIATGGESTNSAGGAGIGNGGSHGNMSDSFIYINILGGNITATGGILGAGIGGGSNCDGGYIIIDNAVVNATAGKNDGSFSGAAIGGGDNSAFGSIDIENGAYVIATAAGGGAGIGCGNDSQLGTLKDAKYDINIKGLDTYVEAYGGSVDGKVGAAGIGAGATVNAEHDFLMDIYITDGATVYAYGGYHSQGIGYGYRKDTVTGETNFYGGGIKLKLDDSITLWSVNTDYHAPALVGERDEDNKDIVDISPTEYSSLDRYLITYTDYNGTSGNLTSGIAIGSLTVPDSFSTEYTKDVTFNWKLTGDSMQMEFNEPDIIIDSLEPLYYPFAGDNKIGESDLHGNWATLGSYPVIIKVDYEFVGDPIPSDVTPPELEYIEKGTKYNSNTQNPTEKDGYVFDGWYTDEDCKNPFVDGTVLNENTRLYGKWVEKSKNEIITGTLIVKKTVTGNSGNKNKYFNFTVTLEGTYTDEDDINCEANEINGTYGDMEFENGVATLKLKHGEQIEATGIPSGLEYTVKETEANKSGYKTTSTNATGIIPEGETITVSFSNSKSSSSTTKPDTPKEPTEPDEPIGSDDPIDPNEPEPPVEPEIPEIPEEPIEPEIPTVPEIPDVPQTGDNIQLWITLMLISFVGIIITSIYLYKKED